MYANIEIDATENYSKDESLLLKDRTVASRSFSLVLSRELKHVTVLVSLGSAYTEDAGLPYFDRAAVIANGN